VVVVLLVDAVPSVSVGERRRVGLCSDRIGDPEPVLRVRRVSLRTGVFTVIKPTADTANDAIRTSLKQSQQQLDEAKRDAPTPEAKHQLSQVERLTACLQDAGIDTDAVRDCQAKYQP
jgi:hypothetical protein